MDRATRHRILLSVRDMLNRGGSLELLVQKDQEGVFVDVRGDLFAGKEAIRELFTLVLDEVDEG